jgi:hypothetical protein
MTLVEPALKAEGKSLGKGRFTGCRWLLYLEGKEEELKECSVKTESEEAGVIQTRLLKDQLVLHTFAGGATTALDRIEPEEGIIIATLKSSGAECLLPASLSLNGVLYIEDCNAEFQQERVTHLFIQGPLTSLFVGADTVEHLETSIDGSVVALLTGAHAGLNWSGLPG